MPEGGNLEGYFYKVCQMFPRTTGSELSKAMGVSPHCSDVERC